MPPVEENMYDDEKLAQIRKDQKDPYVMYFIVRKELNMSGGKIAIQVGHGAQMILLKYFALKTSYKFTEHDNETSMLLDMKHITDTDTWIQESFRKVALVADDKQWEKVKSECECFVVKDAGLTEVPAGSETVLTVWPIKKSERPKILQKLQTLK